MWHGGGGGGGWVRGRSRGDWDNWMRGNGRVRVDG